MKICFPVRNQGGKEYASVDDIMTQVLGEPHGCWLAGSNLLWHGGLHVSGITAPDSILTEETPETAVPLQFMAGGEVVAWRVNADYLTSQYVGHKLQYSSTFVLVKSVCQPDVEDSKTWLEFYSLYIGLAPLSAFPEIACWRVTDKGNGLRKRVYSGAEQEGEKAPAPGGGKLKKDTRVAVMKQTAFLLNDKLQPFGMAKALNDKGEPTGNPFWISLDPVYMEQEETQHAFLPAWMQQAVKQGTFDDVVKPAEKLEVAAGDAVGYLSEDIDPIGMGKVESSYLAHIEVLSNDARMPGFLDNPGHIDTGKGYIRISSGKSLYVKNGTGKDSTFKAMSCVIVKDSGRIIPIEKCNALKDAEEKTWYEISPGSWMSESDVDILHQYDLKELGFTALEEKPTTDMSESLREGWMKAMLNRFSEMVNRERGMRQMQVSDYYKNAVNNVDSNGDGELSAEELFHAVHHPEVEIRNIAARMVVKHDSEWFGGSDHHKWEVYFQGYDPLQIEYAKQWRDDMEWMSKVAGFDKGEPVWHMHPVVFLSMLMTKNIRKRRDYNLGTLSSKYETGGRGSQTVSGGVGDAGGVSYGAYQMTSKTTKKINGKLKAIVGGTVKSFISDSSFKWKDKFSALTPGSSEFSLMWKDVVEKNGDEFKRVEHEFIKKTHFDMLVDYTLRKSGVDIRYHSHTLNDVVWSTAVQHGPSNKIIIKAIETVAGNVVESKEYDEELICAIYNERNRKDSEGNLIYFSKNSKAVQEGVSDRFINEKKEALGRLNDENDY